MQMQIKHTFHDPLVQFLVRTSLSLCMCFAVQNIDVEWQKKCSSEKNFKSQRIVSGLKNGAIRTLVSHSTKESFEIVFYAC